MFCKFYRGYSLFGHRRYCFPTNNKKRAFKVSPLTPKALILSTLSPFNNKKPATIGRPFCINLGYLIWWRRRESNPRPKARQQQLLQA